MKKVDVGNLKIDSELLEFINNEAIPKTGVEVNSFWPKFEESIHKLAAVNKKLLKTREEIQKKLDQWHLSKKGEKFNKEEYIKFLKSINYIVKEKEDFKISTSDVDQEISSIAGPQLVVPIDNA